MRNTSNNSNRMPTVHLAWTLVVYLQDYLIVNLSVISVPSTFQMRKLRHRATK